MCTVASGDRLPAELVLAACCAVPREGGQGHGNVLAVLILIWAGAWAQWWVVLLYLRASRRLACLQQPCLRGPVAGAHAQESSRPFVQDVGCLYWQPARAAPHVATAVLVSARSLAENIHGSGLCTCAESWWRTVPQPGTRWTLHRAGVWHPRLCAASNQGGAGRPNGDARNQALMRWPLLR